MRFAVARIRSAASSVGAIGFSISTCTPRSSRFLATARDALGRHCHDTRVARRRAAAAIGRTRGTPARRYLARRAPVNVERAIQVRPRYVAQDAGMVEAQAAHPIHRLGSASCSNANPALTRLDEFQQVTNFGAGPQLCAHARAPAPRYVGLEKKSVCPLQFAAASSEKPLPLQADGVKPVQLERVARPP